MWLWLSPRGRIAETQAEAPPSDSNGRRVRLVELRGAKGGRVCKLSGTRE